MMMAANTARSFILVELRMNASSCASVFPRSWLYIRGDYARQRKVSNKK